MVGCIGEKWVGNWLVCLIDLGVCLCVVCCYLLMSCFGIDSVSSLLSMRNLVSMYMFVLLVFVICLS